MKKSDDLVQLFRFLWNSLISAYTTRIKVTIIKLTKNSISLCKHEFITVVNCMQKCSEQLIPLNTGILGRDQFFKAL